MDEPHECSEIAQPRLAHERAKPTMSDRLPTGLASVMISGHQFQGYVSVSALSRGLSDVNMSF